MEFSKKDYSSSGGNPANIAVEISFEPDKLLNITYDVIEKLTQFQAIIAIANLIKFSDSNFIGSGNNWSSDSYLDVAKRIATAHNIPFVPERPDYNHGNEGIGWVNSGCLPDYNSNSVIDSIRTKI